MTFSTFLVDRDATPPELAVDAAVAVAALVRLELLHDEPSSALAAR